jgi:hypothetical protein
LTIRLLMFVVAMIALLLGAGLGAVGLVRRARHFRQMAAYYASQEKIWLGRIAQDDQFLEQLEQSVANSRDWIRYEARFSRYYPLGPHGANALLRRQERFLREMRTFSEYDRSVVLHYARLKQQYQRAAWRPWESLPPDPLEPSMPPIPPEPPESPAQPDTSPRNPERQIEPRPFLTLAPGRASWADFPS